MPDRAAPERPCLAGSARGHPAATAQDARPEATGRELVGGRPLRPGGDPACDEHPDQRHERQDGEGRPKAIDPGVGLVSLAALVGALVVSRRRLKTLRAWSVTTGLIGLLLVSALAVGRGPLLGQVKPANVDAADAIYQGVTASLRSWTLWLVRIMAVVMVVTLLWGRIGIIPAIERGYRAVRSRAARERILAGRAGLHRRTDR
jgi:hypothetical protein